MVKSLRNGILTTVITAFSGLLFIFVAIPSDLHAQLPLLNVEGHWMQGNASAAEVHGDRLYWTDGGLFHISDLSDPANPSTISWFSTKGRADQIVANDHYAVVHYDHGLGIKVIDITGESNPTVDFEDIEGTHAKYNAMTFSGDTLVGLLGSDLFYFDLSDPNSIPDFPSVTDSKARPALAANASFAFTGQYFESGLVTWDLSDLSSGFAAIDTMSLPEDPGHIVLRDSLVLFSYYSQVYPNSTYLNAAKVSDGSLTIQDTLKFPETHFEDMVATGDSLFIPAGEETFMTVDLSDATNLTVSNVRYRHPDTTGSDHTWNSIGSMEHYQGYVYASDLPDNLMIFDITGERFRFERRHGKGGLTTRLATDSTYIYIANDSQYSEGPTLKVLDAGNPDRIKQVSKLSLDHKSRATPEEFIRMEKHNDIIFGTSVDDTTWTIDISDPLNPTHAGFLTPYAMIDKIKGHIFTYGEDLPGGEENSHGYNILTPAKSVSETEDKGYIITRDEHPSDRDGFNWEIDNLAHDDEFLYGVVDSTGNPGVILYDITDMENPHYSGFIDISVDARRDIHDIEARNNRLFVAQWDSLTVYSTSDTSNFEKLYSVNYESQDEQDGTMMLDGNSLYLTTGYGEGGDMTKYDVSDPSNPTAVARYDGDGINNTGELAPSQVYPFDDDYLMLRIYDIGVMLVDKRANMTAIEDPRRQQPDRYRLKANYPNPFNPTTRIEYRLPDASEVKLTVYDMLGREVRTLVNRRQSAGTHRVTFDGSGLSSGIYIYRIQTDEFAQSRKMLLVK